MAKPRPDCAVQGCIRTGLIIVPRDIWTNAGNIRVDIPLCAKHEGS